MVLLICKSTLLIELLCDNVLRDFTKYVFGFIYICKFTLFIELFSDNLLRDFTKYVFGKAIILLILCPTFYFIKAIMKWTFSKMIEKKYWIDLPACDYLMPKGIILLSIILHCSSVVLKYISNIEYFSHERTKSMVALQTRVPVLICSQVCCQLAFYI